MTYLQLVDRAAEGGLVLRCFTFPEEAASLLERAPHSLFGSHCAILAQAIPELIRENRKITFRTMQNAASKFGYDEGQCRVAIGIMLDSDSVFLMERPEFCIESIRGSYVERNRRAEVGELQKLIDDGPAFQSKLEELLRRERDTTAEFGVLPQVETMAELNEVEEFSGAEPILGDYFLHRTGLMFIHAEDGAGKSLLAMQLAGELATGLPWLGRFRVAPNLRVLYLQGELSRLAWQSRSKRLAQLLRGASERLQWCHERWAFTTWNRRTWTQQTSGLEQLSRLVTAHRPDVVIVDPLTKYYGIAENDNDQNREFCNVLRDFRLHHGVAFILVHHDRKPSQGQMATMRGASALRAEADTSFQLLVEDNGRRVRLAADKMRHGPAIKSLLLARSRQGFFEVMGEEHDKKAEAANKDSPRAPDP